MKHGTDPASMVSLPSMNRFVAAFCGLVALGSSVHALPSDALLDSLQLAAIEHERAGKVDERDRTEALMEMLARQRIVADSDVAVPRKRLSTLEAMRSERAKQEAEEDARERKPPPEVARALAETTMSTDAVPSPVVRPAIETTTVAPPLPPSVCGNGTIKFKWIEPSSSSLSPKRRDTVGIRLQLEAPCGLARIDLFQDDEKVRAFPTPNRHAGLFEFADDIKSNPGVHRLEVLACDTFNACLRSPIKEYRISGPVPPWIPKAVGGLVAVCGLMGLTLVLRRRPHDKPKILPVGSPTAVPIPESKGVSGTLRRKLQQVAQEIGPGFPAVSLRIPDSPPNLSVDPESVGDAFASLLRFHARRTQSGGQILIAMGHGPVSAEVVFEDTATSPEESAVNALFDIAKTSVKERLGMDADLFSAREAFTRPGCSLTAEVRIDGGLRTRMKIPLAPATELVLASAAAA